MSENSTIVEIPGPFVMHRGGELKELKIACERWGDPSAAGGSTILVFTGLSTSAHAASSADNPEAGWWEYMIGPGKPIDTDRYQVVCVNALGSCFGSTGPASEDPSRPGERYAIDFPELSVEDIARAAHLALVQLGIARVHAVIGASLGGMTALAYALKFPDSVDHLISISSAMRATPAAIATRSLQREMVRADAAWQGGRYAPDAGPREGMRLARKLGLMSYRSADEWLHRFGRERVADELRADESFAAEFQIESYLEANARKFVDRFDANCYLYLSRAMDWFDVAEHGTDEVAALAACELDRALVIGVETDALFPAHQQREMAEALCAAGCDVELKILPSIQGHDAFLVDEARFAKAVRQFLVDTACMQGAGARPRQAVGDCVARA